MNKKHYIISLLTCALLVFAPLSGKMLNNAEACKLADDKIAASGINGADAELLRTQLYSLIGPLDWPDWQIEAAMDALIEEAVAANTATTEELDAALALSLTTENNQQNNDDDASLALAHQIEQELNFQEDTSGDEELAQTLLLEEQCKLEDARGDEGFALAGEGSNATANTSSSNSNQTITNAHLGRLAAERQARKNNSTSGESSSSMQPPVSNLLANLGNHKQIRERIFHLASHGQTGSTCGSWAVFNARAIQNLLAAHQPLNSDAISKEADTYKNQVAGNNIDTEEVLALAQRVNLFNFVSIGPKPGSGEIVPLQFTHLRRENGVSVPRFADSTTLAAYLSTEDDMQRIAIEFLHRSEDNNRAFHFVCNNGGHWLEMSVVKLRGQQPVILVLDSAAAPGSLNGFAKNCLEYISQYFL